MNKKEIENVNDLIEHYQYNLRKKNDVIKYYINENKKLCKRFEHIRDLIINKDNRIIMLEQENILLNDLVKYFIKFYID